MVGFHKYHALGNAYLVLDIEEVATPAPATIHDLCDRSYGLGADGILVAGPRTPQGFSLRIYNPDGSEAEKSGNGLRIFARYLWDNGRVGNQPFEVLTQGGAVRCQVFEAGNLIAVDMGIASFDSTKIPVSGPRREVIGEAIEVDGERLHFTGVGIGNPHCVIQVAELSAARATRLGPLIERHPLFPNRTNVQFVRVIDRSRIQMEIWERGAGHTLASGSSSCAAAAACVRLGLCDPKITVMMPGGELSITVASDFSIRMLGPATKVAEGRIARSYNAKPEGTSE